MQRRKAVRRGDCSTHVLRWKALMGEPVPAKAVHSWTRNAGTHHWRAHRLTRMYGAMG